MDRWHALTAPLNLRGTGLEIAPYFYPLLDKAKHDVCYVDCIDNDTIARKSVENPGAVGREIPRIDWVWTPGKSLRSCIPAHIAFDYCVATHVIEHVPDMIGWLNQIFEVMRDGAVLALALPDRRYTMGYYRRETSLGDVIGNWMLAPSSPTAAQIVDFLSQSFHDTRRKLGDQMFDVSQPFAAAPRHYSDGQALDFAALSHRAGVYLDVHCTVWTPTSFVEVMSRVIGMGLINAQLSEPIGRNPSSGWDEFIIHMTKLGEPRISRHDLLKRASFTNAIPITAKHWLRHATSKLRRAG
jgi:hypothetical protein